MNEDCEMLRDIFLLLHHLLYLFLLPESLHLFQLGCGHGLPGIFAFLEVSFCILDITILDEVPDPGKSTSFLSFLFC